MRQPTPGVASPVRWTDCLQTSRPEQPPLIGLVRGEGVGPEVIAAALEVLSTECVYAARRRMSVARVICTDMFFRRCAAEQSLVNSEIGPEQTQGADVRHA